MYKRQDRYRELRDRVEALGPGVIEVIYRGDPPQWLLNTVRVVNQCDAAVVINLKGAAPGQAVCIVPFALYERLLTVSKQTAANDAPCGQEG